MVYFLVAAAGVFALDGIARAAAPDTMRPPKCESKNPNMGDAPCLLDDGSVFGGSYEIVVVGGGTTRKARYIPLSAARLQEAVIPALLAGFDPETTLTEGSLVWVNDHEFTASLSPRGKKGTAVNIRGSATRECKDQPQKKVAASCRFTIQFNPPVKEVNSVTAVIPYRGDDVSGFRPQDVEIAWDAPLLKRPILNLIEGALKEKVVRSVSDYTVKTLSESHGVSGDQSSQTPDQKTEAGR